jgi:hypothetical protein
MIALFAAAAKNFERGEDVWAVKTVFSPQRSAIFHGLHCQAMNIPLLMLSSIGE